jgi:hypothetical protein
VLCEQNHVEAFRLLVYDRRFGLGVSEERVYRMYRIDSDLFEEGVRGCSLHFVASVESSQAYGVGSVRD